MITGSAAVAKLIHEHPRAHKFFGEHDSPSNFADAISTPDWLVMHTSHCWVMVRDRGEHVREVHWFCPYGARIRDIRAMLREVFDTTDTLLLVGETPAGHPNERAARMLARALGATRIDGVYYLPKSRFMTYTPPATGL